MKKTILGLYASVVCIVLVFTSCSKNNDSIGELVSPSETAKFPYSSLTPEQQKEKLSSDANAFLTQIQDISDEKAFEVYNTFDNLTSINSPNVGGSEITSAEDIIKINQFYGKFTWQPSSKSWKEETANQLEFNFPVGTSTGKIVVTGVSSGKSYTSDGTTVELPKQLLAKIYSGSTEVGSIQVNADLDAQLMPNSATVSFNLGAYTYTQNYGKAAGKVTATLKKGKTVLINTVAVLAGNIDDLVDGSDNFSGNFTLQIMDNLAFSGTVDYANYNKELNDLYDSCYPYSYPYPDNFDWDKADENYAKGSAAIFNKYFDVYLVSTKEKTRIAKLFSKAVSYRETLYNYWGDTIIGEYSYTYWEEVPMLRFNDSTEVEAQVYFSAGFDTVIKNFNKFLESFM